jgi:hypothetical protein
MKSKLLFLIIGVVVGFFLHSFWFQRQVKIMPTTNHLETSLSADSISDPGNPVQHVVNLLLQHAENHSALKQEEPKLVVRSVPKFDIAHSEPETTHGLIINEENVAEMERLGIS